MEIVGATTKQMKRNDHVSLDIDRLTESEQEESKTLHVFSDKCLIYRIPKRLRDSMEYMEIVEATTEQMKRNDHVLLDIDRLTESEQEELKKLACLL
uniref:Uncharacterized protein n=1 Tax=Salix viminalis TaxID=40686 RepID=A0A6N2KFF3_SALVM